MRRLLIACLGLVACTPFFPVDAPLSPLPGPAEQPRAVVPVTIETDSGLRCTGVRVDEATVATAAHCVGEGGGAVVVEAGARLRVASFRLHPGYGLTEGPAGSAFDLAQIELSAPNGTQGAVPLRRARHGPADILLPGPASGVPERRRCDVLGRSGMLLELDCATRLGWSGAPIVQDGALVGILSARGLAASLGIALAADATRLGTF